MSVQETTLAMNEATIKDNSNVYENVDANDNFDNMDMFDDTPMDQIPQKKETYEDWGDEDEDSEEDSKKSDKKEELGSEELKLLNNSDGKEKKEEKKEEKEEKEPEAKEEQTEEEKSLEEAKGDGKKLRIKIGDDHYSLDSSAKLKVKVDGSPEEVTVQDLINNYSGKVAYDKKFTEVGQKSKQLEQQTAQFNAQRQELNQKIEPILKILKDPTQDPFDALNLIVDMVGGDSHDLYKRSMEARLDEMDKLLSMSDVEREAYFLKKQNEHLLRSTEKRNQEMRQSEQFNQLKQKVDSIRQAYGVSEDQYVEAFEELSQIYGDKGLKEEDIVDWASIKPHIPTIQEIVSPYVDEIEDSKFPTIVADLSRYLRDGKATPQKISQWLKDEYGVPSEVKQLNTKLQKPGMKPKVKEEEAKPDSFATFEDLF